MEVHERHTTWMRATKYREDLVLLPAWRSLGLPMREELANILLTIGELRQVPTNTKWLREATQTKNKGFVLLKGRIAISREEHGELECTAPLLLGEMLQFNPAHLRTATVVTRERCLALQFCWEDFWREAADRFTERDQAALVKAVERYAWKHFTEFPE